MLFDVVLDLFLQLLGRLCSLGQHYGRLYYLTPYRIRRGRYTALKDIWKLHYDAFNLKWSDTVSTTLNNVIHSTNIPVVAVLVHPCSVSSVIKSIVPHFFCLLFVSVISSKETTRSAIRYIDYDFSCFSRCNWLTVAVHQRYFINRSRLTH